MPQEVALECRVDRHINSSQPHRRKPGEQSLHTVLQEPRKRHSPADAKPPQPARELVACLVELTVRKRVAVEKVEKAPVRVTFQSGTESLVDGSLLTEVPPV